MSFGDCYKVVLIHGLVVHPDYRKLGVTEEFVEMIYRDFHAENVAIIALVKPFQDNINDTEYYYKIRNVRVYHQFMQINEIESVPAVEYYGLDKLIKNKDTEINEYKLFAVAQRCGFTRIAENHLFLLNPLTVVNRIKEKLYHEKEK
jgi:GNAT superfamily N-acetyltransferase